ncbi:zinc ribbon domain-containing protein, partial [Streptomyces sp. NPDC096080]|uniref:zinc ribbon domain-containing protein n=1 Tax=Streptomyces sp. NPDC096080 TaxID=3156693 RepID=UPI00332477A3
MSQMPQLSACPSCEWPLESGDRFCGACGYDLSAVPARPDDHPTVALNGAVPPDPRVPVMARVNRAFMHRATRWLAHQGVRQFL